MNLTCDIVMDLVAVYKDKVASPDSVKAIEAHLKECRSCRQYYKSYDTINNIRVSTAPPPEDYYQGMTALSAKLRKKHIISNATIGAMVALTLSAMVFSLYTMKKYYQGQLKNRPAGQ